MTQKIFKSSFYEKLKFLIIPMMLLTLGVGQMWGAAKQRYIYCGISNEYDNNKDGNNWGFNFWGGTSGGVKTPTYIANWDHDGRTYHVYRVQVYDDNNKAQFKGNADWWDPDGGYSVTLNGTTNNAVFWSHTKDGWGGQFQENYQVTSTASLSATSTSIAIGSTSTLTPSLSSNSTYNEIKSTSYEVTTNPNSGGSVTSAGVFSATKAGSYTVTATVTYNAKDFSDITKTATATKTITVYSTITLNTNGGNTNGSARVTLNATSLSNICAPTHATTGYTIRGYYKEPACTTLVATTVGALQASTGYTNGSKQWTSTANQTLYAQWTNQYTITFNEHGADIHGTESTTATYGSAMPAATMPSKTGYSFRGYYTGADSTGTKYYNPDGTSATTWAETADTELHACWKGNSYQVAFDANEGSGSMANQNLTYGAAATALTSNTYTREGYYFLGWNSNADGSGTDYYNGESVQNLTSTAGGIVTLYAQWAKKYTVYFVLAGIGWNPPYAKAKITFDGQTYYPITGSNVWSAMTSVSKGIYLANASNSGNHNFSLYKIEGIPAGAQIDFSNNGSSAVGYMSWAPEKPYFMYGNTTWYGIDKYAVDPANKDTIVQATEMSVHLCELNGSDAVVATYDYGLNVHGSEKYAVAELKASTKYKYKYFNWIADPDVYSGYQSDNVYIMNENTTTGVSAVGDMNASPGKDVFFYTTVAGEYKFMLTWNNTTPQTQMYYPVGVSLGALDVTQAAEGTSTTVTLTATPAKTYLMTNPTYYYQMSTDNKNWTTIATSSSNSYAYTFAAQTCKFRVILENDAKLKSTSGTQSFTAYSTKSFYVYNPYNTANNWSYLHLYTWDSNDNNRTYNGSFPTGNAGSDCGYIHGVDNAEPQNCLNGNTLRYVGNNWFYITINESANCFMLVGEATYSSHQTVTCYVNNYIQDGKYMIYTRSNANYVETYDAKGASDYRLKYTDGGVTRYSPIYNTTLDGTEVTTSMWMNANSSTASITIQQGTGNKIWADRRTYSNSSSDGFGGLVDSYHRDHGYAFLMKVTLNTGTPTSSTITNVAAYTGSYYVRTDGLEGGWNVYKTHKHTMHHSEASLNGTPAYNYYLCKWIGSAGTNVKFTVANDYNPELVASLEGDVASTAPLYNRQTIPTATNVRFSWNSQTNTLTRAYLSAATDASSRFLVMTEKANGEGGYTNGKIYDENGCQLITGQCKVSGLYEHELLFEDLGNWVYQLTMQAHPGATAKVTAKYNGAEPDFIPLTELIGGTDDSRYTYRIVYDFKTNILTNAWVASNTTINTTIDLNTNVMIMRGGQNAATQITFGENGQVIHAKKLIGVMEFAYDNMVGKMSSWNSAAYQYCMYYISFPFDVNVSDIFGIGEYGIDWKLQYYDGADRAARGFYEGDGTTTFWKDMPANGQMDEYVGYSLLLNRVKFNDRASDIWENKGAGSKIYLYFPSTSDAENIESTTKTVNVPAHACTKGAFSDGSGKDHNITDSHWNMVGIPIFANKTTADIVDYLSEEGTEANFRNLYAWDYTDNSLSVERVTGSFTFQAMKSYMVQFHGPITFTGSGVVPASVAARRTAETRNYNIELQVLNVDERMINHAYVSLEEGADADFALNEDLYMNYNNRTVNVYTFAGNYDVAANVLPIANTTIPVGVKVKTAGTYLFSMPSDFSGTVTLVDNVLNTRTNLALDNYAVYLEKGTINNRFSLELNIQEATTSLENVDGNNVLNDGKAHKFIQNGQMYILRDGVIYDARGARVQ